MSTKSSIKWGQSFHLYHECFDDENVYLQLDDVPFEVSNRSVTVTIPLAIWEYIRHGGAPDFTIANLSAKELRKVVETEVDERIERYNKADKKGLMAVVGLLTYGDVNESKEEQIKNGLGLHIEGRYKPIGQYRSRP